MLPARADLDGKIAVLLSCLVRYYLDPIKLKDSTGGPLPSFWIVDSSLALFNGQGAGSEGKSISFALECSSRCGFEHGKALADIKPIRSRRVHGLDAEASFRDILESNSGSEK